MTLLSQQGGAQVEAAIKRAEALSAGEIVVSVVERSGTYGAQRAILAGGLTLCLALIAQPELPVWATTWLLVAELPAAILLYFLCGLPVLLRPWVGAGACARAARKRANQLFVERGIYHTRDHSGVLILISEAEHRVVILADCEIDRRMGADAWRQQVATLVAGVRTGRLESALVEVVEAIGKALAEHFPRRPDDVNELDDAIVRGT